MNAYAVHIRTAQFALNLFAIGPSSGAVQARMHDLFDLAGVTFLPL